jgi:hypothetical protein
MRARIKKPRLTISGGLAAAPRLGPSATAATIDETTLYLQRFARPFGRED